MDRLILDRRAQALRVDLGRRERDSEAQEDDDDVRRQRLNPRM